MKKALSLLLALCVLLPLSVSAEEDDELLIEEIVEEAVPETEDCNVFVDEETGETFAFAAVSAQTHKDGDFRLVFTSFAIHGDILPLIVCVIQTISVCIKAFDGKVGSPSGVGDLRGTDITGQLVESVRFY